MVIDHSEGSGGLFYLEILMKTIFEKYTEKEIDFVILGKPKRKDRWFYLLMLVLVFIGALVW